MRGYVTSKLLLGFRVCLARRIQNFYPSQCHRLCSPASLWPLGLNQSRSMSLRTLYYKGFMDSEEHSLHPLMDIMAERFSISPKYFNILRNTGSYFKKELYISGKGTGVYHQKKAKNTFMCS